MADTQKVKHTDFGEKIGGARKDFFSKKDGFSKIFLEDLATNLATLNSLEREEFINKSNLFAFSAQAMRDKGVEDPAAVKYMQAIRNALGTKPNIHIATQEDQREAFYIEYIEFIKFTENLINESAEKYSTFPDVQKHIDDGLKSYLFKPLHDSRRIGKSDKGIVLSHISAFSNTLFNRIFNKHLDTIDYASATWDDLIGGKGKGSGKGKEQEESIETKIRNIEHLSDIQRTGLVFRPKGNDIDTESMQETFSFKGGEFGNWLGQEERSEVLNMAYDSLMDLSFVLGSNPKDISLDSSLSIAFGSRGRGGKNASAAHYEPARRVINLTRMSGAGSLAHEWFHALDNYLGSFSFEEKNGKITYKNEITGNMATSKGEKDNIDISLVDEDSVRRLLLARQALMELGAKLRYKVENSSDALMAAQRHQRYAESIRTLRGKRKESAKWQLKELGREYGYTNFYASAINLDSKKGKEYYGLAEELAARAFESYVMDKLKEEGYLNDYLVASTKGSVSLSIDGATSSVYPKGEERVQFNKEFDNILEILYPRGQANKQEMKLSFLDSNYKEETVSKEIEEREEESQIKKADIGRQLMFSF